MLFAASNSLINRSGSNGGRHDHQRRLAIDWPILAVDRSSNGEWIKKTSTTDSGGLISLAVLFLHALGWIGLS